ncbi:mediator of RNA polymerase II mRNAion subunit 11 [Huso huso]|uniref:Mediator of RNA polymerase II transcription subunit 11 n=1 Tax=Huso huso TaxID=61971 RepID=A0ABR0Y2B8_HUSHU
MANDRLRSLEEVEKEIGVVLQCAGTGISSWSSRRRSTTGAGQTAEPIFGCVSLERMSGQIRYLTPVATGQPHEGSTYSARKDCQMALNRVEYARLKLGELGQTCERLLDPQT